ncbi:GHMP family kinase ATP-binding protein [Blattabacterium cuenoti]|uniref:GHMP family kinase ATP-binding protein n=1 Tax=Blattabacterium cuenoti TaxID=1653831 RepID=UPI00163C9918|nr:mevalonate kinase [Blattabacterium cuenoti]
MRKYTFPSKILLFGEYGIIENHMGLLIPNNLYKGHLKFNHKYKSINFYNYSNNEIKKYFNFLKKKKLKLNLVKLEKDLKKGIFFKSNIPQGYGIGSSGALTAAIYDRYSENKLVINKKNLISLKFIFSEMESFFHGKSSGIDPLICYLKKPIIIRSNNNISILNKKNIYLKKFFQINGTIFLIDSGFPSKTISVNNFFIEKLKQKNFKKIMKDEFAKYNEKCINFFLKKNFNDSKILLENIKKISIWIFNHFQPMIPKNLLKIWIEGIINNDYYLKLCGSGGGGYVLGFTQKYENFNKKLKKYVKKIIYV